MFAHRCTSHCYKNRGVSCEVVKSVVRAKTLCERCPVLPHCRLWALDSQLSYGTAGAMTASQRHFWHLDHGSNNEAKRAAQQILYHTTKE